MVLETQSQREEEHDIIGEVVPFDDVVTLDGYKRDVILINDHFPGPTISVIKGVQVKVKIRTPLSLQGLSYTNTITLSRPTILSG